MSRTFHTSLLHAALLTAIASGVHAAEFVYQGQLDDRGVSGEWSLRPAHRRVRRRAIGIGLMAPIEFPAVEVKDGRFELRFDAPLAKEREAWLEVAVRDVGSQRIRQHSRPQQGDQRTTNRRLLEHRRRYRQRCRDELPRRHR